MAIEHDDSNTSNGGQMAQALGRAGVNNGGATAKPVHAEQQQMKRTFSFREMGKISSTAMGRTPASEVLTKLKNVLSEVYKNTDQRFEVTLIPIDMNQTASLTVSVLVVAVRRMDKKELGVAYHPLLLEASAEQPAPRYEQIGNNSVEVLITMSDADNDRLASVVMEYVARQFPQSKLWNAASEVVPRDFNINDEQVVWTLAANAVYACTTELDLRNPEFVDIDLAEASREEILTCRVAFPKTQIINAVGQSVRADISIDLQAAPQQQNQQQMERVSPVARINGYLDLVYAPAAQVQQPWNPYPQQMQIPGQMPQNIYQKYAMRFVMTAMESVAAPTLAAQLLTLVMASSLRENNNWVQALRPTTFTSEIDIHDIGAVGIEANFENDPRGWGTRIDTRSESFKQDATLAKLVGSSIQPGLILSLDVEECGSSTWINGIFAASAEGNAKATDLILQAANHLTHGAFQRHFPGNGRVAIDEQNRIHLGYYIDRNGVRRDLRDIDYLAVLNMMGEKDLEVVRDWSDTFMQTRYPLVQRLAARLRIMKGLFGDSVTVTGFARRVTFENAFVDALVQSCLECGLDVKSVLPYSDVAYERATAQFTGHTLLGSQSSGLFRGYSSFGAATAAGGNRPFATGRWF